MKRLRASLVLPMHWFGRSTLESFVGGMADVFEAEAAEGNTVTVSLRTLPRDPKVLVLQPRFLPGFD